MAAGVGFAADLDVDLSLESVDRPDCMLKECSGEAVMQGIITVRCRCPQSLCLPHYERELPRWLPGDEIWCYHCVDWNDIGVFVGWEKL